MEAGKVIIGCDLDTSGLNTKLDNVTKLLEKEAKQGAKKFNAAFVIGVSALSSVISKILSSISATISDSISRVDTLENFPKVMSNLGIDSKDAATSVQYLSEKLTGLPTTLNDAVSSVQRFTSANNNVKASTEIFLALNNAILAGGAPMEQQQSALEQLSQAYAKGKPDMIEWRSAMTVMPAQLKQVAEAMGYVSADKLGEALRNGDESMNNFMLTLVKMNKQGIKGYASLEEQAKTGTQGIQTSLTNLKTAVVKAGAEILQTIGQQNIATFFNTIISVIKSTIPYISAFVKSFMSAVNIVVSLAARLANAISGIFGIKKKKDTKKMSDAIASTGTSMNGLANNTNKAAGSAKKLNKELGNIQGFDEMNVLQEPASSDKDSDTSGNVADLGELANVGSAFDGLGKKISEIIPNIDLFTAAIWGLVAAWAAFKGLKLLDSLGILNLKLSDIVRIAAGIGLVVSGVIIIVQSVIDYLNDPTWENFSKILLGIGLVAAGVALIFGTIPAIITAIILLIAAIGLAIYKHWDEIKAFLEPIANWIYENIIKPVVDFFKKLWDKIKEIFTPVIEFFKEIFETTYENIKTFIDNFKQIFKLGWEAIKIVFKPVVEFFKGVFDGAVKTIKKIFEPLIDFFTKFWDKIKKKLKAFGEKIGEVVGGAFKTVVNGVLEKIENILNFPVKAMNKLIDVINTLPGVNLKQFKTYNLPRLAKGGIINQPGRGVPVGSAIAGERGQEGVLPLTDSQQMQLLGEAIGRYVTINASITNTMNGRVISRELQKINNTNSFAFNR